MAPGLSELKALVAVQGIAEDQYITSQEVDSFVQFMAFLVMMTLFWTMQLTLVRGMLDETVEDVMR